MYALDPRAKACFNVGDLTNYGNGTDWFAHHKALAKGAPDSSVPDDPSGIDRKSRFRTDVTTWGPYVRYLGVMGNHDMGDPSWHTNWNNYLKGQSDLGVNSESGGVYYSVAYENTLFIALDSMRPSDSQTDWLQKVLKSPEAQTATWKIAFFHHPVYPCNAKSPFSQGLSWVRLLEEARVDVAFVAHSHTYERTCPMVRGRCDPSGVIYLNTSGGAGPLRDVYPTRTGTVTYGPNVDNFNCAEILESYGSIWHFVHGSIDDCKLTLRAYLHDFHTGTQHSPYDTAVIDKCK
jgi:hypothetical protein